MQRITSILSRQSIGRLSESSQIISFPSLTDLIPVVIETCHVCRLPEAAENLFICESERFGSVVGQANFSTAKDVRRKVGRKHADGIDAEDEEGVFSIILNKKIFWGIPERVKVEIIVHETCHIIDFYLQVEEHGRVIHDPHGERWESLMYVCGYTPREYIPKEELGIVGTNDLYCSYCDSYKNVGKKNYNLVKSGKVELFCGDCRDRGLQVKFCLPNLNAFNLDKRKLA